MLSLRYYQKRIEEMLTFADCLGIQGGNPDSILSLLATQLWNEETKEWVDFEEAKTTILAMPVGEVNRLTVQLMKDFELSKLFGGK